MNHRLALALVLGVAFPGDAFARCEDTVPQAKPQNTFAQDVGRDFDKIIDDGWIEFAVYEDFFPWSYEEGGQAKGVDIEIGRIIAADLGVTPRFRLVQAGENLEADLTNYVWKGAAVDGRVSDAMLHVPYDSALVCRIEQVAFTGQYMSETIAIAYRPADYPDKPPTPAFFRYDPVAVENDSISDFFLTNLLGAQAKINRLPTAMEAVDALASGQTMAVMAPRGQLEGGLSQHPDGDFAVTEPALLDLARGKWTLGVGVNFQHKDLGYAIDMAIETALADGRIAAVFQDHGLTFTPPTR